MPSVIYRDPKIKINAVVYKDTTVRVKKLVVIKNINTALIVRYSSVTITAVRGRILNENQWNIRTALHNQKVVKVFLLLAVMFTEVTTKQ